MEEKVMQEEPNTTEMNEEQVNVADNSQDASGNTESAENEAVALKKQIDELKDKYLRLVADFDNFRKRNARERIDLIQTASKDVVSNLLPVLDDSERAE